MSERHYKWRDIGKPTQRLTAFLTPNKDLPSKFAPSRERSQSVDKLFNSSRSRIHSSTDIQPLNQTQDSFKWREVREDSKKKEDVQEKKGSADGDEKKTSLVKFPTLSLGMQQSSLSAENRLSAVVVTELKKEFWAFKQNVLRELERQKELVLKFVKEIVLTVELQMQKLAKRFPEGGLELKSMQTTTDNMQVKTLEDWKASLAGIKLTTSFSPTPVPPTPHKAPEGAQQHPKSVTSPIKLDIGKPEQPLAPPSLPIDVSTFLNSISALRRHFTEMDKLLEVGDSKRTVKG